MKLVAASMMVAALALQGCATKTYGRQGELTSTEKATMTCREIELDQARTEGWIKQVNDEARFSGRDVLAILGDFGIGNAMERDAALKSANARLGELNDLRAAKHCGAA